MRTILLSAVLVLASPLAVTAEICDDVNELSNTWNELANFMHEHEGDGFTDEEANHVDDAIEALQEPTRVLGTALSELGDEDDAEIGDTLLDYSDELDERKRGDLVAYLVDVIDDVVDTLDEAVDYCDIQ